MALFIGPEIAQVEAAKRSGAPVIELHTGTYADASGSAQARELERLVERRPTRGESRARGARGPRPHLPQRRTPVAAIPEIVELNIGHCIVARAIFTGLDAAVRDMKALMIGARR